MAKKPRQIKEDPHEKEAAIKRMEERLAEAKKSGNANQIKMFTSIVRCLKNRK